MKTANRINLFTEYVFSTLGKKIKEVESKSKRKVLNFGPGNPNVSPSTLYIDKFIKFIKDRDAHLYPDFGGKNELAVSHLREEKFLIIITNL